jgi:hypothetical protein
MESRVEVDSRRLKLKGESIPNPPWVKIVKEFDDEMPPCLNLQILFRFFMG